MATVYLARDLRHNRRVALKVLRPDLAAVLGSERFLSEIEVTANLQHPNLLPLFDSGAAGDLLFYVMPYVQGESLRARLDREKQLPVDEAVRLATAIANALDYAHRQGVIHRDLKPENVLLQEGQPLVADFGIALAVSKAGGARVTQTGLSLGTPQYMSPEQATGDRVIDARTDIYSLGALTYEMLTGEPPHVGSTAQAIIARLLTERPRPARSSRPAISEQIELAVERALEKLPADRWATGREFAEALSGARPVTRAVTGMAALNASGGGAAASAPTKRVAFREIVAWTAVAALAIGAWWLATRPKPEVAARPIEFELTRPDSIVLSGGSAARIAITPDGRTVVFVGAYPNGTRMLFSRSLADRSVRVIQGSEGAGAVVVSPDGTELPFSGEGLAMMRLPLVGGTARLVAPNATSNGQFSWGADGRVLFATSSGISIKNVDADGAEQVVAPDTARRHRRYGFPHWLPGQQNALVSIWRGSAVIDSVVIGVLTLADRSVRELDLRGIHPRFSRTGHLMYLLADGSLTAVPFDPVTAEVTGRPSVVQQGVAFGGGAAASFAVAEDGTLAMVVSGQQAVGGLVSLVAVGMDGGSRDLGVPPGSFRRPRVSPDGRQVTFVGAGDQRAAGLSDVWRAELSPAALHRVTTSGLAERPQFARDSKTIFFGTNPPSGALYEVGLEAGSAPRERATWDEPVVTGDLGPSSGYAVFGVVAGASTDLWIAPMTALDKPEPFAAESYSEVVPRVSPDGRFVAFISQRTGADEIYIRQLPRGGEEVRVSGAGGYDPVWAPDGRSLYYRSTDSLHVAELSFSPRVSVSGRRGLFALDQRFVTSGLNGSYDILPNGKEFVMFERRSAAAEVGTPIVIRMDWARTLGRAQPADAP